MTSLDSSTPRVTSTHSVNSSQQSTAVDGNSLPLSSSTPASNNSTQVERVVPSGSPALLIEDKFINLLNSDQAIDSLLLRLKKSINTCDEFGKYIRKKATLEQDHEEHLKKISRATQEALKNAQSLKSDSFTLNFDKIVKVDERMSSNGSAYSKQLSQMHDELASLSGTISRHRKNVKENFKRKEKELADATNSAEKAKSKYDQLCGELERVRTYDPYKKTFTLKGSKTSGEQEEIIQRKVEAADVDYQQKVATLTGLRNVFINTFRPNIAKQLKDLIIEIDIAMSAQLQRYATRTEDLALQTALSVNPMQGSNIQPLKSIASSVDNERDLYQYVLKSASNGAPKQSPAVEYKPNPLISPPTSSKPTIPASSQPSKTLPSIVANNSLPSNRTISTHNETPFSSSTNSNAPFSSSTNSNAFRSSLDPQSASASPYIGSTASITSSTMTGPRPMSVINNDNIPLPPGTIAGYKTFGSSIDDLMKFEGQIEPPFVPSLVRQCIYVVDKYGLDLEGIYRTSGNIANVNSLKDLIDKDPSNVKLILPNPTSHSDSDIYAVASLLKNLFSSLPESLLTNRASPILLEYVKLPDLEVRKKKIHEVIYELPDGPYWTLRSLILHLARVSSHQDINLMNARNLSIIWGPTLFPKDSVNAAEMSYQGKVVEHLIIHAIDYFEDD